MLMKTDILFNATFIATFDYLSMTLFTFLPCINVDFSIGGVFTIKLMLLTLYSD